MSAAPNPYGSPSPWAAPATNPDPWGGAPSRNQGGLDPRISAVMSDTKLWLNIVGWGMIAGGVMYCLTLVGIIVAWLPIWMGLSLTKAAKAANNLRSTGDPDEVVTYLQGVKVYFMITGFGMLLGFVVSIAMLLFLLATGGFAALATLPRE
jgi:hypothetical protein